MNLNTTAYRLLLAERLGKLRTQFKLSQRDFKEPLDLGQNVILRSEKNLNLSVDALLTLTLYYIREHDINPNWLFNPDNSDVPMLHSQASFNRRKVNILDYLAQMIKDEDLL